MIKDFFLVVEFFNFIFFDEVIFIGVVIEVGIFIGKENLLVEDFFMIECLVRDILVKGVDELGVSRFIVLFLLGIFLLV